MPPLERHALLRPMSREHHDGLLLCWYIRKELTAGTDPAGVKQRCARYFREQLLPHFAVEEEAIFPILGADDPLVKVALAQHRRLTRLFLADDDAPSELSGIEEELDSHIRFEERELFQRVQAVATEQQLERVERVHGMLAWEAGKCAPLPWAGK